MWSWSAPLLFACNKVRVSHVEAQLRSLLYRLYFTRIMLSDWLETKLPGGAVDDLVM